MSIKQDNLPSHPLIALTLLSQLPFDDRWRLSTGELEFLESAIRSLLHMLLAHPPTAEMIASFVTQMEAERVARALLNHKKDAADAPT